ncbi:MAG: ATP-binding protein [Candidatus Heimdallarchaeota archaeon]|nr:ATP-binding protein [Candidatus Heimdallarchaeota archaeon]
MPKPAKKIGFVLGVTRERDTLIVRLDENVEHEDIVEGNFVSIPLSNGNTLIGRITAIRAENPQLSDERYAKFWMDRLRKSLDSRSMLEFTEFHIIEIILVSNISFEGDLSTPNAWVSPGSMVFECRDDLLELAVFGKERGAMEIGLFGEHSGEILVNLNPNNLGSDGLAIFGSRGSGKSYAAGVIIEEFTEYGLPTLIVDPHGEYWGLSHASGPKGEASLPKYFVKVLYPNRYQPRYYKNMLAMSKKLDVNFSLEPVTMLFSEISTSEMFSFMYDLSSPQKEKIENTWYGIREAFGFAVCYDIDGFLGFGIENNIIDGSSRRPIVRKLEVFRKMGFFTEMNGAICHQSGSIIQEYDNNHRRQETTEKTKDLTNFTSVKNDFNVEQITILDVSQPGFDERARRIFVSSYLNRLRGTMEQKEIQRIFVLIEEAHRFIPIGESPTKRSIEWFAREGRKMGAGLGIVSQRPSGLDRDILSQCNSKLILRITEQSDILVAKDILAGFAERYIGLLPYLERGTGVLTGAALRIPILVKFRERKSTSKYGETVSLVADPTSKVKSRTAEKKEWT